MRQHGRWPPRQSTAETPERKPIRSGGGERRKSRKSPSTRRREHQQREAPARQINREDCQNAKPIPKRMVGATEVAKRPKHAFERCITAGKAARQQPEEDLPREISSANQNRPDPQQFRSCKPRLNRQQPSIRALDWPQRRRSRRRKETSVFLPAQERCASGEEFEPGVQHQRLARGWVVVSLSRTMSQAGAPYIGGGGATKGRRVLGGSGSNRALARAGGRAVRRGRPSRAVLGALVSGTAVGQRDRPWRRRSGNR